MKIRNLIIILCLTLAASCWEPAYAQLAELGLNPFRIDSGSRPLGMGGGFAGLVDDVNAAVYNPAGLAWTKGISVTVRDAENLAAIQAYPTGYNSSFGFAVLTSSLKNIPISTGVANTTSNLLFLSYGTKLSFLPALYNNPAWQRVGIGMNIKALFGERLVRDGFIDRSATGWDLDLGVLWKPTDWWSAGASLQNILPAGSLGGGEIKWDINDEKEGIPSQTKLAASARIIGDIGSPIFMEGRELLVAGEIDLSPSNPMLLRLGGEWNFGRQFYLRTGFMQQYRPGGVLSDINFGMGYREEDWGIDFASAREPIRDQRYYYLSVLYLPKDWIVVKKLDVEKPAVVLEEPFEKISIEDNISTYDEKLEVFGKVKPGVEVFINGLRASLDQDNYFKTLVPLEMEKNVVMVEARYQGEKNTWKYKVLRKARVRVAEEKMIKQEIQTAVTEEVKRQLAKKEQEITRKKEQVEALVTMGVVEVPPEGEFSMDAGITRGELCSWLVKSANVPLPEVKADPFPDVKKGDPLAPYVQVVIQLNLLQPYPDGTFRPNALVTKEEGEAIFRRLLGQAMR